MEHPVMNDVTKNLDKMISDMIKSKKPYRLSILIRMGMMSEYLKQNGNQKTAEFKKLYDEIVKEFKK